MARFVKLGDCIEAEKSTLNTRRKFAQGIIEKRILCEEDSKVKIERFYKYKCSIQSIATITKELNPKKCKLNILSNLDLDDEIHGEVLEFYSADKIKFDKESNFSSTHSIFKAKCPSYLYGIISIPFRRFLN